MPGNKILVLIAAVALGVLAWRAGGWPGIALLATGLVMWVLLYYNRVMTIMKRAADRPIGYVGSAVMLNAKLKPGMQLLQVVALTRSLGQQLSEEGADPEVYRWSDPGHSNVTCEFKGGRLAEWRLYRPPEAEEPIAPQAHPAESAPHTREPIRSA